MLWVGSPGDGASSGSCTSDAAIFPDLVNPTAAPVASHRNSLLSKLNPYIPQSSSRSRVLKSRISGNNWNCISIVWVRKYDEVHLSLQTGPAGEREGDNGSGRISLLYPWFLGKRKYPFATPAGATKRSCRGFTKSRTPFFRRRG